MGRRSVMTMADSQEVTAVLFLQQVKAGYGGKQVLQIDELRFRENRISILIGRNGSGKSTLLKAMAGILPYKGEILASGEDMGFHSVREMSHRSRARKIGLLPQTLHPADMDVETLVMHGRFSRLSWPGRPGKQDVEAVKKACRICGIEELFGRSISGLSGGERQICYLAMVIAQDPEIFLLDEPMSAMDIAHQLRIMEIMRTLKKEGKTIIMTSHDLPQSFTLADRIALLSGGKLLAEGTPEELSEKPDIVKRAMGAAVRRAEGEKLLYPYVLTEA